MSEFKKYEETWGKDIANRYHHEELTREEILYGRLLRKYERKCAMYAHMKHERDTLRKVLQDAGVSRLRDLGQRVMDYRADVRDFRTTNARLTQRVEEQSALIQRLQGELKAKKAGG